MDATAIPAGLRVLVVEDEAFIALNLEHMLEELGCKVIGPLMRYKPAENAIDTESEMQAAILDVNIGGTEVFPLADKLVKRGIPFVFATGYGRAGLPAEWQDRPVVQKPHSVGDLETALLAALNA